ncbi:hypothetical protein LGAA44_10042 [Leuconostoc gasicomitatum]|nr:hypothetical protein LGAA44_10042 [Leuconostoc gasicomitatum]
MKYSIYGNIINCKMKFKEDNTSEIIDLSANFKAGIPELI